MRFLQFTDKEIQLGTISLGKLKREDVKKCGVTYLFADFKPLLSGCRKRDLAQQTCVLFSVDGFREGYRNLAGSAWILLICW